ncbi:hypothetical protein NXC14_CH02894 [Rhizobium sp. NXC14]|nr:hypothetical protein NXC14_CH02894 [Rhizobium sp. NXC14]
MKSRLRSCSPQPKTAKKVTIRQPAAGRAATRPASINILHFFHPRRCLKADEGLHGTPSHPSFLCSSQESSHGASAP